MDERARRDAERWLARRPLTEHELRARLARAGHPAPEIEAVTERLLAAGLVYDRRLAADFIALRSERLGHGPDRLLGQLVRRGVSPAVADRAWHDAVAGGEVDPLAVLRRRLARGLERGAGRLDPRSWSRMYNALLRAGFPSEMVERELEPHRPARELTDDAGDPDER
jgi:SOS response regulatory protein OraA/RecX